MTDTKRGKGEKEGREVLRLLVERRDSQVQVTLLVFLPFFGFTLSSTLSLIASSFTPLLVPPARVLDSEEGIHDRDVVGWRYQWKERLPLFQHVCTHRPAPSLTITHCD